MLCSSWEWIWKKKYVKARSNLPIVSKSITNPNFVVFKEMEGVKKHLQGIEETLAILQESIKNLVQLGIDTSIDMGKVHVVLDSLT